MGRADQDGERSEDPEETAQDPSSLVQKHEAQDAVRFADEDVEVTLPDGSPGLGDAPDR